MKNGSLPEIECQLEKIHLRGSTGSIRIEFSNGFRKFSKLTYPKSIFPEIDEFAMVYATIKELYLDSIFIPELNHSNVLLALVNLEILKITDDMKEVINSNTVFKSLKTHKKIKVLSMSSCYKISSDSHEFIEMIKMNK